VGGVHPRQIRLTQGHAGDHDCVALVIFAGPPTAPTPLGGEVGRNIHDGFSRGKEQLGESPAVAFGAFNGDLMRSRQGLHAADELAQFPDAGGDRAPGDHPALRVNRCVHVHLAVSVHANRAENHHTCPFRVNR
jgi:hypothetical protein